MKKNNSSVSRRKFMMTSTGVLTMSLASFPLNMFAKSDDKANNFDPDNVNIIGPKEGFSPHIGSMYSMMNWMRGAVLNSVKELNEDQLDFHFDKDSNSIGAMLLHLAATERYYQLNTFDNMKWGTWDQEIKDQWDVAMNLGETARNKINGHKLTYYIDILTEVRQNTIDEFKRRDDDWLLAVDEDWYWGPTNNYCKWFHVCEHESNHNGQIKWIRKRLPG
ncbi:DinB family protein [Marinigracilibium pacificum]|uniref:DinB family protein n=1 Tax=Marinigracilibium pacificum TaxID=2729599 RepID=A0A848J3M8_9BACT|nr:DinB family protein [Marinigracilibium pacificum]NMM49928.1 DinB family protein [Marinigracilibium pacificum]